MAYVAPTTRADGYVVDAAEWNKNTVANPIALNAGAIAIASQAANDVIYASSATQLARLAAGTSGQVLQTNGAGSAPSWVTPAAVSALCQGRLSLTTGVPVTTADVTAATTLYWVPYAGNAVGLYSGSAWVAFNQAQLSIAVPATTATMYDVFLDYNSGTPALSLTAWSSDTARATALTTQDGVLVLTGSTGKRYVGSFRTTGVSGQTEDSFAKRYVWNYYNRVPRPMRATDGTDSWTYTTATWRQAGAVATNKLEFVIGVAEIVADLRVRAVASNSGVSVLVQVGIGLDSTSAPTTGNIGMGDVASVTLQNQGGLTATLTVYPAVGYHYAAWLERSSASGTTTWYGDNGDATLMQNGISGWIEG